MSVANLGLEPFKVRPYVVPPETVPFLASPQVVNKLDKVAFKDSRGNARSPYAVKLALSLFCSRSDAATS